MWHQVGFLSAKGSKAGYTADVYHDVSGKFRKERWVVVAILYVPVEIKPPLIRELYCVRQEENYWGRIRYSDLPSRFSGSESADARVARRWLSIFSKFSSKGLIAWLYAIDQYSPFFREKHRKSKDFQLWNFFSARVFKWGLIDCCSSRVRNLSLCQVWSHYESRSRHPDPKGQQSDNFVGYFKREVVPYLAEKGILVTKGSPYIISVPRQLARAGCAIVPDEELMQLCDLIAGLTRNAIALSAKSHVKISLALEWASVIDHGSASDNPHLRYYPDEFGYTSRGGPLAIMEWATVKDEV